MLAAVKGTEGEVAHRTCCPGTDTNATMCQLGAEFVWNLCLYCTCVFTESLEIGKWYWSHCRVLHCGNEYVVLGLLDAGGTVVVLLAWHAAA